MSRMEGLFTAWGRILSGRAPNLSIEITRECPLRCPGCYAFGDDHLGGDVTLRDVADYKGDALVQRMLHLIDEHKPIHLSIVGGEPHVDGGAFAFRPTETKLRDAFNVELAKLKESGELLRILKPFGFTEDEMTDLTAKELCGG